MAEEFAWTGKSGKTYTYRIYTIGTDFKDVPGNYIYAKVPSSGGWRPVYIGQTSSLKDRLASHEKETCAKKNGATHIHVHSSSSSESARLAEERDLITKWKPVCNEALTG